MMRANEDEAIRIATVIRVLIHNTGQSISLLKHLHAENIDLLSTCGEVSSNATVFFGLGTHQGSSDNITYLPCLEIVPWQRFLSAPTWWHQVVYVLNQKTRLTRKDIITTAANKDGGAHVDSKLTPEYEALKKDGALGWFSNPASNTNEPFTNAHFVAIRQMAFELLNSTQLLKLTTPSKPTAIGNEKPEHCK